MYTLVKEIAEEDTTEVHIIEPDGSDDHVIWTGPQPKASVFPSVGWRPDGLEISLESAHEHQCSRWDSDIYGLKPDGSAIRRITSSPDCATLAQMPQGSVQVPVSRTDGGAATFFEVYIEGAQSRQEINLLTNTSTMVTFDDVADLGAGFDQFAWIHGFKNFGVGTFFVPWLNPQTSADVVPGQTTTIPGSNEAIISSGNGAGDLSTIAAWAWNGDSTEIAYDLLAGFGEILPVHPSPLQNGPPIFGPTFEQSGMLAKPLAWSPLADEFLYYTNDHPTQDGIYRAARGAEIADHVFVFEPPFLDVRCLDWLPDGSGFTYFATGFGFFASEIGHFDFTAGNNVLISAAIEGFGGCAVSPDGAYLAWSDCTGASGLCDLKGTPLDGSSGWLIAADVGDSVSFPDWGVDQPSNVPPTADYGFTTNDLTGDFTDSSSDVDGTVVSWDWDFDDGTTSTARHPFHTFATAGTYAVSLTATDDAGAPDTTSMDVMVGGCDSTPLDLNDPTPITGTIAWADCEGIHAGPFVLGPAANGNLDAPAVTFRNGVEIGANATIAVHN